MADLGPAFVEAALLRRQWNPEAARRVSLELPFRTDPDKAWGTGDYFGGEQPYVVIGMLNQWGDSLTIPPDEIISHEAWHWWDDVVVGGPGVEVTEIEAATRELATSGYPVAARAAETTIAEKPADVVHWGHHIWDRVGQDIRRLPPGYVRRRLSMLAGALLIAGTAAAVGQLVPGSMPFRFLIPVVPRLSVP